MNVLNGYEPHSVLKYFEKLSSVPHGSGNTKAISDLCVSFAQELGLDHYQDEFNNVIIYKDGTAGYENKDRVILQGHLDMVCIAAPDSDKDLHTDPIDIMTDGEYIWADKTSLGADDIIAPAMMFSILESNTLQHPPLCCVLTTDEEIGMNGARNIDKSKVVGSKLINLDSEIEGSLVCGCAGALRAECLFDTEHEQTSPDDSFYILSIDGLLGGHSAIEITKNRANAVRLLARLIYGVSLKWDVRLCSFFGGNFDNAIPTRAEAVVAVNSKDSDDFIRLALKHERLFVHEYSASDPGITVSTEESKGKMKTCISRLQTKSLMRCLCSVPDGLKETSSEFPGVAILSSNIGIAELSSEQFRFVSLIRSNKSGGKESILDILTEIVEHDNGRVVVSNNYPEWEYNTHSVLREVCMKTYKSVYNSEMKPTITHGGIETAYFLSDNVTRDAISIGPQIDDIHSARERISIKSIQNTYRLLLSILHDIV